MASTVARKPVVARCHSTGWPSIPGRVVGLLTISGFISAYVIDCGQGFLHKEPREIDVSYLRQVVSLASLSVTITRGTYRRPLNNLRRTAWPQLRCDAHNRVAIEAHPMASRIQMIEGSSIAPEVVVQVREIAAGYQHVLVCLDSNHVHSHVLAELEAYAPLTSMGSYCVVFDTIVEDVPAEMFPDRPWGPGDNPKTAMREYLKTHKEFQIDKSIQHSW
jgi:Cephalosporin hydroxylase